jgi:uncharacterized protein
MQFIRIVERIAHQVTDDGLQLISPDFGGSAQVAPWSVESKQFGRFLCAIFDEWVRKDVGRYYVQLFDVSLETWCGMEASLCVFRRQCGSALALEHSGDVYSCDHFVYPQNKLGNIMEVPCRSWSIRNNKSALGVPRRLHYRVIAVNAMCASPAMGSVPSIGLSRLRTAKQD